MSENYDPVDNWLRTDVELLSPPVGTFERVQRRAKRRKTVVAMSTAAAVAVVVAAAAALPQLISLPGQGGPERVNTHTSPSPSPSPSRHSPKAKSPRSVGSAKAPGTDLAITSSSFPAAARFAPTSITFVGSAVGAVIGQTTTSCPVGKTCTTIAGTMNYGQSWTWAGAPPAGAPDGGRGVSQVRFLDDNNGWAFGPQLFATHNGGASWTAIHLPGRVVDLATVGGAAFAVVARCSGTGANYTAGCTSFALYTSAFNANDWQQVDGAAGHQAVVPGGLQFTGQYGYLLAGSVLYAGSPAGGPWSAAKITSKTVPSCLTDNGQPGNSQAGNGQAGNGHAGNGQAGGGSGLIAPGVSGQLYLTCQPLVGQAKLYSSPDSGQTWSLAGQADVSGVAASLAVVPQGGTDGGAVVLATSAGIYLWTGTHWHPAKLGGPSPAGGFSFVGMTTNQLGVALPANPQLKEIYLTSDGGLTWHQHSI